VKWLVACIVEVGLGLWSLTPLSTISWRSVLLVEEIRVPGENNRPVARHWQTLSHNVAHLAMRGIQTGNWRKPLSCRKSLTNFYHIRLYRVHLAMNRVWTHNFMSIHLSFSQLFVTTNITAIFYYILGGDWYGRRYIPVSADHVCLGQDDDIGCQQWDGL
jgi:hypothetical protein